MPSPFPGMDPWLEGHYWTTIHASLACEISRQLVKNVRPKYCVLTDRRDILGLPGDAGVVRPMRVPHFWVEIREVASRRIVTVIQFLTPTNKREPARWKYLRRRRQILETGANLIEIDLLRHGERIPIGPRPEAPYYVTLNRAGVRVLHDVWPIGLTDPLPRFAVPLLPGDPEVELDLQQAFTTCYDITGYQYVFDNYEDPPDVPLTPDEELWADERIRHAGYRSG